MNTSLFISSGAMQAYQQKIDNTANNVANVNTNGYKRKDHSFSEILASQINHQGRTDQEVGRLTPDGLRVGYGTRIGLTQTNMEQGQAIATGNPFDLMIKGNGFFQVGYPGAVGVNGEVRFTRDGSFHLTPNPYVDGSYHLVNANGGYLLDQNGQALEFNDQYEVNFTENGQIQLRDKNGQGIAFRSPQQVGIVDIQNPNVLENLGNNEFGINAAELPAGTTVDNLVRMMQPGEAQLSSGYLEGSNVDLTTEMVELMTSQRSFQMNARAVSYADQMMGIASNILR
ncbi:flagellar basal-body rod protein FlgG [Bacillus niacini]|uniref:Flagellar basal-body rod protein FlgG n=1 Tax=Neobacillus niacini TaxID=86668 RepID=A0A852TD84_9BACI|nr:flagellar hook-basal body protein [Neobacillus niacini]NYE06742.1 flagellar basal-body rod protein FlgG [Neobacillus niacini]